MALAGHRTTTIVTLPQDRHVHRGLHNWVVLLRLKGVSIVNFGVLAALGGAVGTWMVLARQIQAGMLPERFAATLFLLVPALVVLGSRLFVLALEWRDLVRAPLKTLLKPGFAFQGGFIAGLAGVAGIALTFGLDLLILLDTFALGIPLGHAIGRLGCHSYGCCHGKAVGHTGWAPGIRYTNPDSKAVWGSHKEGALLHPTQFYSFVGNFALFIFLAWLADGARRPGELAAAYLMLGSAGRFFIEFLRGIPARRYLGLTTFQWVAGLLFLTGAGFLLAATGQPHTLFMDSGTLLQSLMQAAEMSGYFVWVFALLFVCFGIHGPHVGHLRD